MYRDATIGGPGMMQGDARRPKGLNEELSFSPFFSEFFQALYVTSRVCWEICCHLVVVLEHQRGSGGRDP